MDKAPGAFRTISEVSDWLETPAHVLRFWETRFTQLKPVKRAGGRRYYRPGDMALLGGIKKLLHDDGVTIRGVQKILREQGVRYVATLNPAVRDLGDAAALGLDHDEFGPTRIIASWKADQAADSGGANRPALRRTAPASLRAVLETGDVPDTAQDPVQDAAEAPMHENATEADYAPVGGATILSMATAANAAPDPIPAEPSNLEPAQAAEAPGATDADQIESDPIEVDAAAFDADDLAALDQSQSDDDLIIPPELEEEWATLLAEEAALRTASRQPTEQAPAESADPPPAATASAPPLQPDLFATARPQALPALLAEDPGALPPPVATLLRRASSQIFAPHRPELSRLLNRMAHLREQLAEAHNRPH